MKISNAFSQTIKSKIQFIISLFQSYLIQITAQAVIIQHQSSIGTTSLALSLDLLVGFKVLGSQVITTIETATTSTSTTATTSAAAFFDLCEEFHILISSVTFASASNQQELVLTLGTKIIEAGSSGVTIPSSRFQFFYLVIINSIKILLQIIEVQISLLTNPTMMTTRPTVMTTNRPLPTGFFTGMMTTRNRLWRSPTEQNSGFFKEFIWNRLRGHHA